MLGVDEIYRAVLGPDAHPYRFQRQLAEDGLPEILDVPTGCGKTPAVMLGWIFRRFHHPDPAVRAATPTRLIWCLPLRTLTTQTAALARRAVESLRLADELDVHLLMGGEPVPDQQWRLQPQRPAIIVSTLDMALSRALNRGYLASRYSWPIDFALFNDDCHWVYDEVQLMGTALLTSRQMHGLRGTLGVRSRHSSTWMSATVDQALLQTVDAPAAGATIELGSDDRLDPELSKRLGAPKRLLRARVNDKKKFAAGFASIVNSEHVEGSTTLAVLNSVRNARDVAAAVRKTEGTDGAEVVLLHSRFRPGDRADALARALAPGRGHQRGRIVVSTQVIEAGADLSSATLVTECAPWSSLVQRAGRCNRWGEVTDARMVVVESSGVGPYDADTVEQSWAEVSRHEGSLVTPDSLAEVTVAEAPPPQVVLRRKDLIELFDTTPDLSGNDIDVSRFIRADGELDLAIAWRSVDPGAIDQGAPPITRDEGCPVPIGEARSWLKEHLGIAITLDSLQGNWRLIRLDDVRPGARIVVDVAAGGYHPEIGFSPKVKGEVAPVGIQPSNEPTPDDEDKADSLTTDVLGPVSLAEHLTDTERAAGVLCDELGVEAGALRAAVLRAARLHDLGKAHPAFQHALHERVSGVSPDVVLAKSGGGGRLSYGDGRRGFRHELVSALVLLAHPRLAGEGGADPALVTYLVGAHHGRIRLGLRSLPGEDEATVLGVREGDEIPPVDLGADETSPTAMVSLEPLVLGGDGTRSWSAMATDLLERYGPFQLAWLEMVVRIADWRASIGVQP